MNHSPCFVPNTLTFQEIGLAYAFETAVDLSYHSSEGRTYTVPRGFQSDFGSIPRLFWSVIPPHGKGRKAFVLHDYLVERRHPWGDAAKLFKEALYVCEEKPWRIAVMYRFVLWYGKFRKK